MTTTDSDGGIAFAQRWRRYGHDRLYIHAADGIRLGYRDLTTSTDHATSPEFQEIVARTADSWLRACMPQSPGVTAPPAERPWQDLSRNAPGAGIREVALAKRAEAPVRTALARLLDLKTEERAWRVGAEGEQRVAEELQSLARRDPAWTAIHSIPVGTRGSDIDHVVMGPGGVFTVNTKCHPAAKIWVGGGTFLVNGQRTPYVRNARHEAQRSSRLLSEAAGMPVHVEALIVPVSCKLPLVVKAPPGDGVHVVIRRDLQKWLRQLGPTLHREQLATIWEAARRSTTWTG